jgi:hypothetical protein
MNEEESRADQLREVLLSGGFTSQDLAPRGALSVPLTAKPSGERRCVCVTQHRPEPVILHSHHVWPLGEGGPDIQANLLWVCPSTHSNIHELWRLLVKAGKSGVPLPWREHRLYSEYVRGVVARGYAQAKEAGQVP